MRHVILTAELGGAALLMLALAAPASGQTLGEVSAATGIHGTLARQGVGNPHGTLDSVKRSLASSTKPKDPGFGSSSGSGPRSSSSRRNPTAPGSGSAREGRSGGGTGSWVTAGSSSRGSASSAWLQGGSGWATGGGGRTPASRRPRS